MTKLRSLGGQLFLTVIPAKPPAKIVESDLDMLDLLAGNIVKLYRGNDLVQSSGDGGRIVLQPPGIDEGRVATTGNDVKKAATLQQMTPGLAQRHLGHDLHLLLRALRQRVHDFQPLAHGVGLAIDLDRQTFEIIGQGLQHHHRMPLGALHLGREAQGVEDLDDLDQPVQGGFDAMDMVVHLL